MADKGKRAALFAALGISVAAVALQAAGPVAAASRVAVVPGMPAVPDPDNLYSEIGADKLGAAVRGDLERVYVPDLRGGDVAIIDPASMKVVDRFKVGRSPQHVVPAWDLRTLWVTNDSKRSDEGSLTPIDPRTGRPGPAVQVDDRCNMYATPGGKSAIVAKEVRGRLDFRDPQTLALQYSIEVPGCPGTNHADFSIDARAAYFTCEFSDSIAIPSDCS